MFKNFRIILLMCTPPFKKRTPGRRIRKHCPEEVIYTSTAVYLSDLYWTKVALCLEMTKNTNICGPLCLKRLSEASHATFRLKIKPVWVRWGKSCFGNANQPHVEHPIKKELTRYPWGKDRLWEVPCTKRRRYVYPTYTGRSYLGLKKYLRYVHASLLVNN